MKYAATLATRIRFCSRTKIGELFFRTGQAKMAPGPEPSDKGNGDFVKTTVNKINDQAKNQDNASGPSLPQGTDQSNSPLHGTPSSVSSTTTASGSSSTPSSSASSMTTTRPSASTTATPSSQASTIMTPRVTTEPMQTPTHTAKGN